MVFTFILCIMFLPPAILIYKGVEHHKINPRTGKLLIIAGAVYLIVGLGLCGSLLGAF